MTDTKLPAVALFERGYTDLVSVLPPDATLSPNSKISPDQAGKAPGRRNRNGTWGGYDWRAWKTTVSDARAWSIAGANIGLRSARWPGLDIDSMDAGLADQLQRIAELSLGLAPVRFGRAPKRLMVYRATEPFARMRMFLEKDGVTHLVEVLGDGQQYLVHGTHPTTRLPYTWSDAHGGPLTSVHPNMLAVVDAEKAHRFFERASEVLGPQGYVVRREGDGRRSQRTPGDQKALVAPSLDALQEAVACVPNSDILFPGRDEYVRMGYAIRASWPDDEDAAYTVFASWAARHEADERVTGNPETWRGDWRRMRPPYSVGWDWIAGIARDHGYTADARDEFTAEGTGPTANPEKPARSDVWLSDRWLANRVVVTHGDRLRYSPETGKWLVWDGRRWTPDDLLLARAEVGDALGAVSRWLRERARTEADKEKAVAASRRVESVGVLDNVTKLVQARSEIAIRQASLDADPWLLNTPAGAVNLLTGEIGPALPEQLSTKLTAVGPDFGVTPFRWFRFLTESASGDGQLVAYLKRLAGYVLTGSIEEQVLVFVHGKGGNGKSVFLNAVRNVMGDYAKIAAMDTFTATKYDKHTTDLADLMGARLVTASETQVDRAWDEQRVKQLSGGDPVKARFMRQDNFQYTPAFKLVFIGNHKPRIKDLDEAMRRRFHLVPFTAEPKIVDKELGEKLKAEYPAILAWMIEGALEWRRDGLMAPDAVRVATTEYLADEDAVGRWLGERTVADAEARTLAGSLFEDWSSWCGSVGEEKGSQRKLGEALGRRFPRSKNGNGLTVYEGVALRETTWPG